MEATSSQENLQPELRAKEGKYLTFRLLEQEYGFEILKVQEIIKMQPITQVPRSPAFVSGVINLRGKVIPVVDLRLKFGMPQTEETERTCIIVVQMEHDNRVHTMGAIVDEVSEVIDIPAANIEPAPELGAGLDTDFILGLAKMADSVTILLDTVISLSPTGAALSVAIPGAQPVDVVNETIQSLDDEQGKQ